MPESLPPLSLYIHLPWCVRKCPYCDFNSHSAGDAPPLARYLSALLADLDEEAGRRGADNRPVETVFIGGGTPSLFPPDMIAKLLDAAHRSLGVSDNAEITMEANPGTLEFETPAAYRQAGVNRLSLGAQSFSADSLQRLGRIHGPDEIVGAFEGARAAGFDNINLDLMFGLPAQSRQQALLDVQRSLALGPEHVSYYQLTLEPNTVFYSRVPPDLPDDDACWDMQEAGHRLLTEAGFERYEVSAFARAGHRCRHNTNYWQFGDYLAVGAGAHGKFTASDGTVWRYRKPAHPAGYMREAERGTLRAEQHAVPPAEIVFEYMLNALRLPRGFSEESFEALTGQPFRAIRAALDAAREDGLLERRGGGRWRPTALGLRFLNDLQVRFLPASNSG